MSKILNPAQAKAVYDAMCALNNVSGTVTGINFRRIFVTSAQTGEITVCGPESDERHPNQAAFAAAYNLEI